MVQVASFWLLCFISITQSQDYDTIGDTCDDPAEYFDLASLECQTCPQAKYSSENLNTRIPDLTSPVFQTSPSLCRCSGGLKKVPISDMEPCYQLWPNVCPIYECLACADGTVPSQDKSTCLSCPTGSSFNETFNDCSCPSNHRLVEKSESHAYLSEKKCVSCAPNEYAPPGSYQCQTCPDPNMVYSSEKDKCTCDSSAGYQSTGIPGMSPVQCILTRQANVINAGMYAANEASKMTFSEYQLSIDSALYRHYYLQAAVRCYFYTDESHAASCQQLANLCVLEHFDSSKTACALFQNIQKMGRPTTVHDLEGWSHTLPFLEYEDPAETVLGKGDIAMEMEFEGTTLNFVLARYSINGTFLGFEPVTNQFQFCESTDAPTAQTSAFTWAKFGHGVSTSTKCQLSTLKARSLEFYELFLVDAASDAASASVFYPIPVRVLNYRSPNGIQNNINTANDDLTDDVLTHRFFLVDAVSTKEETFEDPKLIRYAESVSIHIQTQDSASNRILPPVLTIHYTDALVTETLSVRFKVEYTSDTSGFWTTAIAFFTTMSILCGIFIILRFFNWQRRCSRGGHDPIDSITTLVKFITEAASVFAPCCFWLLFSLSSYYFIAFKWSTRVSTLLPEDNDQYTTQNEYYAFQVLVVLAFCLQMITLMDKIVQQSRVELFFVDWEKPRAKVFDSESATSHDAPVSVWRTILVANEWNELQTLRRTSTECTIIALAFLLVGCKLEYLATPQPSSTNLSVGHVNTILRFFNTSFWWLVLSYGQLAYRVLIHERYITEPKARQFIDLCTMAKVSVVILDERYHGYYLHCRSPYPFADGSMVEIADQLKQEEAGLMSGRGLPGAPTDVQVFEMYITLNWRKNYDRMYAHLVSKQSTKHKLESGRLGSTSSRSSSRKAPPGKLVKASRKLNTFLKSFVENHDDEFRWKYYQAQGWLSEWLQIPPEMGSKRTSYLIPDTQYNFAKVLFLGIEHDLIIWNILVRQRLTLMIMYRRYPQEEMMY